MTTRWEDERRPAEPEAAEETPREPPAGEAPEAPPERTEGSEGQEDELEAVLSRPEVAERVTRRAELHTRQLVRLFERAEAGDEEAAERLRASREGRRLLELLERRARDWAAQEAQRLAVYRDLLALREQSPQEFARYMASREWREFANEMEERYGQNLAALPLTPTQPSQQPAQVTRQSQGASRVDELELDALFERLRSRPLAKLLTERDWEQLDPTNFQDQDPREAMAAMTERFAELVARRRAASPTARAERERSGVRQALRGLPPAPTGGPWWLEVQEGSDLDQMLDAYNQNPKDPALRKWFSQMRERAGWSRP